MNSTSKILIIAVSLSFVLGSSAWGFFETNKDLVKSAKISLAEAVSKAAEIAPGKAVEAQIGEEDDRVVFWVQVIDSKSVTRTIYVDAENGNVVNIEKD